MGLGSKNPWRRQWQPTLVLSPGKPHGWRSVICYSPWGHRESDTTEQLHFTSLYFQEPELQPRFRSISSRVNPELPSILGTLSYAWLTTPFESEASMCLAPQPQPALSSPPLVLLGTTLGKLIIACAQLHQLAPFEWRFAFIIDTGLQQCLSRQETALFTRVITRNTLDSTNGLFKFLISAF